MSAALFLLSMPGLAQSGLITGKIISVGDGDTVTAQFGSKKATIRLACIDAAEMKQTPWGGRSGIAVNLLKVNEQLSITNLTQKFAQIGVENTIFRLAIALYLKR